MLRLENGSVLGKERGSTRTSDSTSSPRTNPRERNEIGKGTSFEDKPPGRSQPVSPLSSPLTLSTLDGNHERPVPSTGSDGEKTDGLHKNRIYRQQERNTLNVQEDDR